MEEVNSKRMTWEEIVEAYPDKWVALVDCNSDGAVIEDATVLKVCDDDDVRAAKTELRKSGIHAVWCRTTELEGANILCIL